MTPTVHPTLDADLESLARMLMAEMIPGLSDARRLRLALVQTWLIHERLVRGLYDGHARGMTLGPSLN